MGFETGILIQFDDPAGSGAPHTLVDLIKSVRDPNGHRRAATFRAPSANGSVKSGERIRDDEANRLVHCRRQGRSIGPAASWASTFGPFIAANRRRSPRLPRPPKPPRQIIKSRSAFCRSSCHLAWSSAHVSGRSKSLPLFSRVNRGQTYYVSVRRI